MSELTVPQPVTWWWEKLGTCVTGRIVEFDFSSANNLCEFLKYAPDTTGVAGIEFDNGMIAFIRATAK